MISEDVTKQEFGLITQDVQKGFPEMGEIRHLLNYNAIDCMQLNFNIPSMYHDK